MGGVRWRSFVAVGDSFTEGLDDPYPGGDSFRGWADLVAATLAATRGSGVATPTTKGDSGAAARGDSGAVARGDSGAVTPAANGGSVAMPSAGSEPTFGYANLAIRGRLFHAVVAEQLPAALAMRPDLVSFAAGGNDVLRRHFDPDALITQFDRAVGEMRATGADVIVFRFADVTHRLPGRRMVLPRVQILNQATEGAVERHGAILVDLWSDDEFRNPLLWSTDRLHLSAIGHRRVAGHVLTALGVTPEPEWLMVAPPPAPQRWLAARSADLRWAGEYLAPWLRRRLTGRSSGDTVTAKRPTLTPFGVD
jgi:lysophospholipase L1-like esterase